jgi:predicted polyphosphate/ATP-dependent NAD kinase
VNPTTAPVGIIANPVSARDIRRIVANASSLQIADRANIVLRVLAALAATGVRDVVMMPDKGGIKALVRRGLERSRSLAAQPWPAVRFLDMPVQVMVEDTLRAAESMVAEGVGVIVVLGGDGTHRAVASVCGQTPIAGLSTGTNNAFPELREPTITGIAAGLVATGSVDRHLACRANKILEVRVNDGRRALALVDVCITTDSHVGARALWKPSTFSELFVTFAEAHAIGLSAIAGLLHPVSREAGHGLKLLLGPPEDCAIRLSVPIAPGLICDVGVRRHEAIAAGEIHQVQTPRGVIALDGEREIELDAADTATVRLETARVSTVDVSRVMAIAAEKRLFAAR